MTTTAHDITYRLEQKRRVQADFPTINWTVDQLAKGIFYHARELNDAFTSVFT